MRLMRFRPGAFDAHLNNIGQEVHWRRSYSCACTSPSSGQPDPKHALCGGKGRIWEAPVPGIIGIASQKTLAQWIATGRWEQGDAVVSVPQSSPVWNAGQFDRIVMKNSTDTFSQPLTRGAPSERLLHHVASVKRVFYLDPVTRLPVECPIPQMSADGVPSWSVDGAPPPGTVYSITGDKHPEYFLFDNLADDRNQHSGMRLPKRIVLRQWSLWGRG